mmetsp:Transcript_18426/g.45349  ORF Transcript_18426/g.45349 Transcript_18426/m.45349 type:complete len:249 (+) Transcript_18426:185-931(+)
MMSFALVCTVVDGVPVIDTTYFTEHCEQHAKVYPTHTFLGWYAVGAAGAAVQPWQLALHKQVMELNEAPLFLLLDAEAAYAPATKDLPIAVYETDVRMIAERSTLLFAPLPFKIETNDAERISVDHVAHLSAAGGEGAQLTAHLGGLHSALYMLKTRVEQIEAYLRAVGAGELPFDHDIMRRLNELCHMLPALDSDDFKQRFLSEYNDGLLVTYLAALTKGAAAVNSVIDKHHAGAERGMHARRRPWL